MSSTAVVVSVENTHSVDVHMYMYIRMAQKVNND